MVALASVSPADAVVALEAHEWVVDAAAKSLLQDPTSRKRKAPPSFDPTPQASTRAKPKKKSSKTKGKAQAKPKAQPKAAAPKKPAVKPSASTPSPRAGASSNGGSSQGDNDSDASGRDLDEKSHAAGEVPQAPACPEPQQRGGCAKPACPRLAQLKVPLARVRRAVVEGDVKQVKPESLVLIAKAAELFVEYLVESAYSYTLGAAKQRGGEEQPTSYVDLANAVGADSRLAFLADIVPPKRKIIAKAKQESAHEAAAAQAHTM